MKRILVAYATMAGSTAKVAKVVGEEIAKGGTQVENCMDVEPSTREHITASLIIH